MKRSWLLIWYALLLVLISPACSVTIAQTPPATTNPTGVSLTPASLTGIPAQRNKIGNPLLPTTTIPVTWANLNLTGKLIYISAIHQSNGNPLLSIQALDLGTGLVTTIFQGPDVSWIYYVSVSPDEKQLVMAYSSPPQGQSASNPLLYICLWMVPHNHNFWFCRQRSTINISRQNGHLMGNTFIMYTTIIRTSPSHNTIQPTRFGGWLIQMVSQKKSLMRLFGPAYLPRDPI